MRLGLKSLKHLIGYKIKYGRVFEKELQKIVELAYKSKEEIEDLKSKEFVAQFRNAFENSKFYNKLYQEHGLNINSIKGLSDIEKVPIIDKSHVRENTLDFLTKSRYTTIKAYTSGTSGSPLTLYRDILSTIKESAYCYYYSRLHGYELGDPMVSMRGTLDRNTFSYLDKSSNVLYLSSYHLKEERIEEYYQKILDFKPKVIEAYPSSLHILATELHKRGIEIDIPIAFTSSEVVHDFQRELIEEIFKTKIYDWYGNAERTVALGQFDDQLYRELPLYSHLEVKDDHLITTSFINAAFPLIRYKVDDVIKTASNTNGECVVVKIEGRDDDYVILTNGQKVGRLDLAFKKVKNLLGAQIIQTAVGSIQVNFVPGKDFSKANLNELQANLINLIGPDCRIKFDKIDAHQLIRTKSGKFKLVVSML